MWILSVRSSVTGIGKEQAHVMQSRGARARANVYISPFYLIVDGQLSTTGIAYPYQTYAE